MNTLVEKANTSRELSELPLLTTGVEQGNAVSPVLATPAAFAAGVAAAGAAIGNAID